MRIRVVRVDGTLLRPVKALVRLAGAVVGLSLFLGYIPILLSDHRRALPRLAGRDSGRQPTRSHERYPPMNPIANSGPIAGYSPSPLVREEHILGLPQDEMPEGGTWATRSPTTC